MSPYTSRAAGRRAPSDLRGPARIVVWSCGRAVVCGRVVECSWSVVLRHEVEGSCGASAGGHGRCTTYTYCYTYSRTFLHTTLLYTTTLHRVGRVLERCRRVLARRGQKKLRPAGVVEHDVGHVCGGLQQNRTEVNST